MKTFCNGLLILLFLCCGVSRSNAADRIWVTATIGGKPVKLFFDTGAEELTLFPKGTARLGLKVKPPDPNDRPPPGKAAVGETEPCVIQFGSKTITEKVTVLALPSYLDYEYDGLLGWSFIKENIVRIDAAGLKMEFLDAVPASVKSWKSYYLNATSKCLVFQIPVPASNPLTIPVDTGSPRGVVLPPASWKLWRAAHETDPHTLDGYYMPGAGTLVKEEYWASELSVGSFRLTDVPVAEANVTEIVFGGRGYGASLGLAALKRLDVVMDGKAGVVYIHAKASPAPPYEHNRLGAVFMPDELNGDDLVAHVVKPGPAYSAGIRNGDILSKIDGLDVTRWRTDSGILPLGRFWARPANTRLRLNIKRQKETREVEVILKDILVPKTGASTQSHD